MTRRSTAAGQTARERIREALVRRIGEGRLAAGDRIVEADLVREFGVSAIPVREAIRELVAVGVLDFVPHRGAWVRRIGMVETIEGLEIKAALEAFAARRAVGELKRNPRELRSAVAGIERAARRRDYAAYQVRNQAFHRRIVEASGNRMLMQFWERLAFDVRTRPIMESLRRENPVAIAREHRAIADAFERGDGHTASRRLARHARRLTERLKRALAASPPEPEPHVSKRTRSTRSARVDTQGGGAMPSRSKP